MTIAILVFAKEFVRSKPKTLCSTNYDRLLKNFAFPTEHFPNSSLALNGCETYCSTKDECWGCSRDCKKSCQWTAIPDCKVERNSTDHYQTTLSQKPGNNLEYNILLKDSNLIGMYRHTLQISFNVIACIDIEVVVERVGVKQLRWSVATCSSGNDDHKYRTIGKYKERCCIVPGRKILSCHSDGRALGWKHAQVRINGHSYCDDFISVKAFREITIHGM